jgi:hypothetical protein
LIEASLFVEFWFRSVSLLAVLIVTYLIVSAVFHKSIINWDSLRYQKIVSHHPRRSPFVITARMESAEERSSSLDRVEGVSSRDHDEVSNGSFWV